MFHHLLCQIIQQFQIAILQYPLHSKPFRLDIFQGFSGQGAQLLVFGFGKTLKLVLDSIHDQLASPQPFCTHSHNIITGLFAIMLYRKKFSDFSYKPNKNRAFFFQ